MLITVIVPTHNRPDRFRMTIARLQHQSLASDQYEVIGIDDGARPASLPPAVAGLETKLIRFGSVRERAFKRNHGAEVARGHILLFCDDDLDVDEPFLEMHVKGQAEFRGAMAFGRILLPPGALADPGVAFRQRLELNGMPGRGIVRDMPNFGTAANMSVPRQKFLSLGGYREAMVGIEDQDLSMRHSAAGGDLVYLPEATAIHDDEWLDFESFCRRQEWGASRTVAFSRAYPNLEASRERESIQGPMRASEGPILWSKKLVFRALGLRPLTAIAHYLLRLGASKGAPPRLLERGYRTMLGAHLVRGYLRGIKETRSSSPNMISG